MSKKIILIASIFFLGILNIFSQENYTKGISDSQEIQIDSLFKDWGDLNKPGLIMGILHNNELVYQKSFGSADIDSKPSPKKRT